MIRTLLPLGMIFALAGCSAGAIEGTLVDGMTNAPLEGVTLVASADGRVRLTCQKISATTDAQGMFSIEGACTGDSAYSLVTTDEELWLGDIAVVPQGGFSAPVEIKAWRAPVGQGVFTLEDTTLTDLRTVADIKTEKLYLTEPEKLVEYPDEIPPESKIGTVAKGSHLVFASKDFCDNMELLPLVQDKAEDKEDGKRRFGDKEVWVDMDPWFGVKFTGDEEWEQVPSGLDTSRIVRQENNTHAACFLPSDIVPPGRYVIRKKGGKRVYMVDFE